MATRKYFIGHEEEMHVSTIELFFDLVFVFTITQLTNLVRIAHVPLDFLLTFVVLMLIWWIYSSYAWLTNESGAQKLLFITAMLGFLVMALALPRVFGADGPTFALAYMFVVILHCFALLLKKGPNARRALLGIAPFNLVIAVLMLLAGYIQAQWSWIFFLAAALLLMVALVLHHEQGFLINPTHFAERHGGIIIIALGESIVAIGTGATDRARNLHTLLAIVLALALIATIWWSYFDRDEERAEHILASFSLEARSRLGLLGYWYTHLVMIAGIVLIATGIKDVIANYASVIPTLTWLLACGISLYLFGDVVFRWIMGIRPLVVRAVGAFLFLLLGFFYFWESEASLAIATLMVILLLAIEHGLERRRKAVQ